MWKGSLKSHRNGAWSGGEQGHKVQLKGPGIPVSALITKTSGRGQARHLIEQGDRKLAFVGSERENDRRAQKRLHGFELEGAAADLTPVAKLADQQGGTMRLYVNVQKPCQLTGFCEHVLKDASPLRRRLIPDPRRRRLKPVLSMP